MSHDAVAVHTRYVRTPLDFLEFAEELASASSLDELERLYHDGVPRFADAPMRSIYLLDPTTGVPQRYATVGVSDVFLERYESFGRPDDPLHTHVLRHAQAASNLDLVGWEAWSRTDAHLRCSRLHRMVGIVEAPITVDGQLAGNIHLARDGDSASLTREDVRTGELLGRVLGIALRAVRSRESLARRCDEAFAALDLMSTPLVLTDPHRDEPYANSAARELLGALSEPDDDNAIYAMITPPPGQRTAFDREVRVALRHGGPGVLHGHSQSLDGGRVVTVLGLDGERSHLRGEMWAALTPREREVAALVAENHTDAEIAAILVLSRHTVSQYVKRIYRKLGVSSRVGLTRLVLRREHQPDAPRHPQF